MHDTIRLAAHLTAEVARDAEVPLRARLTAFKAASHSLTRFAVETRAPLAVVAIDTGMLTEDLQTTCVVCPIAALASCCERIASTTCLIQITIVDDQLLRVHIGALRQLVRQCASVDLTGDVLLSHGQ